MLSIRDECGTYTMLFIALIWLNTTKENKKYINTIKRKKAFSIKFMFKIFKKSIFYPLPSPCPIESEII